MTKTKDEQPNARTSRRQFAKTVTAALVAAAPLVLTANANAQTAAPKEPTASPNPQPTPPTTTTTTPPKPSPVVEAYAEVARARFGEQLSPEELTRVKRDLEGNVRAADRLRASKLKNSDEPDFVFSA